MVASMPGHQNRQAILSFSKTTTTMASIHGGICISKAFLAQSITSRHHKTLLVKIQSTFTTQTCQIGWVAEPGVSKHNAFRNQRVGSQLGLHQQAEKWRRTLKQQCQAHLRRLPNLVTWTVDLQRWSYLGNTSIWRGNVASIENIWLASAVSRAESAMRQVGCDQYTPPRQDCLANSTSMSSKHESQPRARYPRHGSSTPALLPYMIQKHMDMGKSTTPMPNPEASNHTSRGSSKLGTIRTGAVVSLSFKTLEAVSQAEDHCQELSRRSKTWESLHKMSKESCKVKKWS